MPSAQIAYLGLVVVAFVALGLTLAWVSWWSSRPPAPGRAVTKPSLAHDSRGDSHARSTAN